MQSIRQIVEEKLAEMLARNPRRMDYYKKYSEIIADYNREKGRVTIEDTFARLVDLMKTLDEEQRRAAQEGLSEDEFALFDLLQKSVLGRAEREKVKQAAAKRVYQHVWQQSAGAISDGLRLEDPTRMFDVCHLGKIDWIPWRTSWSYIIMTGDYTSEENSAFFSHEEEIGRKKTK
jgi:restriction endonuclease HindI-like protein